MREVPELRGPPERRSVEQPVFADQDEPDDSQEVPLLDPPPLVKQYPSSQEFEGELFVNLVTGLCLCECGQAMHRHQVLTTGHHMFLKHFWRCPCVQYCPVNVWEDELHRYISEDPENRYLLPQAIPADMDQDWEDML